MKYPYIGELKNGNGGVVIFSNDKCAAQLNDKGNGWREEDVNTYAGKGYWNEDKFKNITTEYLVNTYGEVKSKEHAEFIKLLAEVNDIQCKSSWYKGAFFNFYTDLKNRLTLEFYGEATAKCDGEKQITIPLPPESNVNTPEEDFEMKQVAKNNGDNLIFGDADKCKEWPCVNDEVLINIDFDKYDVKYGKEVNGENGVVRSIFKDGDATVYAVSVDGACYCFVRGLLSEPKTPEEKERDEIEKYFKELFRVVMSNPLSLITGDADKAIDHIFENLEIKKKPQ